MAHPQHAAHFTPLDELLSPEENQLSTQKSRSSTEKKQCSYWLPAGRRCSRSVKLDSDTAKRLREELVVARALEGPSNTDVLSSLIEEVLQRFSCWQHKPKLLPETSLGREVRRRWRDQLNDPAPNHSEIKNEVDAPSSRASERLDTPPVEPPNCQCAVPRYNTRSNGPIDPSEVRRADSADHTPVDEFLPMKQPGKTVVQKLLAGPISADAQLSRDLYEFERESSPGMLKLGVSVNVELRLKKWSRKCHYTPILKHHLREVPCAKFVEGLIHSELLSCWKRERQCKHNPNCTTQHQEWFRVDHETASGVMDRWARWMKVAEPYDATYHLRPEWRSIIENMERNAIPVTSQRLLDSMKDLHVDVATLSTNKTSATPTDRTTARSSVDGTHEAPPNTTTPVPTRIGVPDAAKLLSTVADIISSLTPEQKHQLRALLDQGTPNSTHMSLPPPVPIVTAA